MTYDILLVKVEPGENLADAMERLDTSATLSETDKDVTLPPLALSDVQRYEWARVCERFAEQLGDVERYEFPSHLGIASRDPRIRLEIMGTTAAISVPYWYQGEAAAGVITKAYAVGRIVEFEMNFVALDEQTDAGLDDDHIEEAVATFTGTGQAAMRAIEND